MIIISDQDSPEVHNPAEGALDDISSPVVIPEAIVLSVHVPMVLAVRDQKTDPSFLEPLSSRIAVVGLVPDQSLGSYPWPARPSFRDSDLSKRSIKERDLSRRGRVGMASERNTLAIGQHHALRPLSPRGLPDCRAPLFAGKKLASTKTSSQSRMPSWSSTERKARHISLRTSSSYHSLKRRQQVDECGYRSGRSLHLAPVFRTQRIPSNTNRSSALGRPPFSFLDFFGIRGALLKMFKILIQAELLDRNPVKDTGPADERYGQREVYISFEDFLKLTNEFPPWAEAIFRTLYYTGMKRGEVLSMTWEDVNLESRIIWLNASQTKDRRPKRVPIHKLLVPVFLKARKVRSFSGRVFLTAQGRAPREDSLKLPWRKALDAVGLQPRPRIHDRCPSVSGHLLHDLLSLYIYVVFFRQSLEFGGRH